MSVGPIDDGLLGPLWEQTQDVWAAAPDGALERVVGVFLDVGWRPTSVVAALRAQVFRLGQQLNGLNQRLLEHPCELPEHEGLRLYGHTHPLFGRDATCSMSVTYGAKGEQCEHPDGFKVLYIRDQAGDDLMPAPAATSKPEALLTTEFCVMNPGFPQEPHRGPMSLQAAQEWVAEVEADGDARVGMFYVASRLVSPWVVC